MEFRQAASGSAGLQLTSVRSKLDGKNQKWLDVPAIVGNRIVDMQHHLSAKIQRRPEHHKLALSRTSLVKAFLLAYTAGMFSAFVVYVFYSSFAIYVALIAAVGSVYVIVPGILAILLAPDFARRHYRYFSAIAYGSSIVLAVYASSRTSDAAKYFSTNRQLWVGSDFFTLENPTLMFPLIAASIGLLVFNCICWKWEEYPYRAS